MRPLGNLGSVLTVGYGGDGSLHPQIGGEAPKNTSGVSPRSSQAVGQQSAAWGSSTNTRWVTLGTLSLTSVFTSVQGEDWVAVP